MFCRNTVCSCSQRSWRPCGTWRSKRKDGPQASGKRCFAAPPFTPLTACGAQGHGLYHCRTPGEGKGGKWMRVLHVSSRALAVTIHRKFGKNRRFSSRCGSRSRRVAGDDALYQLLTSTNMLRQRSVGAQKPDRKANKHRRGARDQARAARQTHGARFRPTSFRHLRSDHQYVAVRQTSREFRPKPPVLFSPGPLRPAW